jgi:hypothetical protein
MSLINLRSFHFLQQDCEIPKCQQCVKKILQHGHKTPKGKHSSILQAGKRHRRDKVSVFIQSVTWWLRIRDNEDKAG